MIGIYKIVNKVNQKIYIGQSIDIKKRWSCHVSNLEANTRHNKHFQNAWNKYKKENFEMFVVEECCADELNEKEAYYIKMYDTTNPQKGYNKTFGGDNMITEECRAYFSKVGQYKNTNLKKEDVEKIKMCLYLYMDRKEIMSIFNISRGVLTLIATGKSFDYTLSVINEDLKNLKKDYIDNRDRLILEEHKKGYGNREIVSRIGFSESIVEKTIGIFTNSITMKKEIAKKKFDTVQQLKKEGYGITDISKNLSIPISSVAHYFYVDNNPHVEPSFKKIKEVDKTDIIKLYLQNESYSSIAEKYNVTVSCIRPIIENYKYANTEVS